MRPTGGLTERWIIPILREVAEAVYWVHKQGVIHRDIKCANVLITEVGGVQLCDFGVAGVLATKFDKRSTVTGTLHWMAPELFDSTVSYGSEVDIWYVSLQPRIICFWYFGTTVTLVHFRPGMQ
jgi:serine/threonine protein kinase